MKKYLCLVIAGLVIFASCAKKSPEAPEPEIAGGVYYISGTWIYDSSDQLQYYLLTTKTANVVVEKQYQADGTPAEFDYSKKTYDADGNAVESIYYDSAGAQSLRFTSEYELSAGDMYYPVISRKYNSSDVLSEYWVDTKSGDTIYRRRYSGSGTADPYDGMVYSIDSNGYPVSITYLDAATGAQYERRTMQYVPIMAGKYYYSRRDRYDASDNLSYYYIFTRAGNTFYAREYDASGTPKAFDEYSHTYDSSGNQVGVVYYSSDTGAQSSRIVYQWTRL